MIGDFVLSIGSIEDYDKKMYTLKQFFFKALPKVGWNTYQQISVKYNNQIVCKRRKEIKNNKI
jgi:cell division protein FtsQ